MRTSGDSRKGVVVSTPTRSLPPKPSLEHLRKQAKALQAAHKGRDAEAIARINTHLPKLSDATTDQIAVASFTRTDAQLVIAREFGFASWPLLARAVAHPQAPGTAMKSAIEAGDAAAIQQLLDAEPALRDQPFVWVDGKGRRRNIAPIRFAHARDQQTCFDVLKGAGADVDFLVGALWNNVYNQNVPMIKRLLARGIDPDTAKGAARRQTGSQRYEVFDVLAEAGAWFPDNPVTDIHRGLLDEFEMRLKADASLVDEIFDDFKGCTPPYGSLMHIAAGHNDVAFMEILVRYGADVNATLPDRDDGWAGQTPIFCTIGRRKPDGRSTKLRQPAYGDCEAAFEFLLQHGADLSLRARCLLDDEFEDLTPLGFALQRRAGRYPPNSTHRPFVTDREVERMMEMGAPE
jgi:hypothetical protein